MLSTSLMFYHVVLVLLIAPSRLIFVDPSPARLCPPLSSSSSAPRTSGKPTHRGKHGEVYADDDGRKFKCSCYYRGNKEVNTWYEIDESGSRILSTSFKPPSISSKAWVKLSEAEKLEAIANDSKKAAVVIECAPLGVEVFRSHALAAQVLTWSNSDHKLQEDKIPQ